MKLTALKIRDRLDRPSTALFSDQEWNLSLDPATSIVTIERKSDGETWITPWSNVMNAKPALKVEAKK